jgi:hypothetical protein
MATDMDRDLVSGEPHELEYLARKHGTTVENVKRVIAETGSRSRRQVEEALDKQFSHVQRTTQAQHVPGSKGQGST